MLRAANHPVRDTSGNGPYAPDPSFEAKLAYVGPEPHAVLSCGRTAMGFPTRSSRQRPWRGATTATCTPTCTAVSARPTSPAGSRGT